jgi:transcription-repair coupling factor (superfamily II helicase)
MQTDPPQLLERLAREPGLLAPRIVAPTLVARAAALAARRLLRGATSGDRTSFARSLLVVVPDPPEAEELCEAVRALIGKSSAQLLEPWDILPFEPASLEPSAAGSRVESLVRLAGITSVEEEHAPILLASARAVVRKTLASEVWRRVAARIAYADECPPSRLRTVLQANGYRAAAEVSVPGDFASRGGILDFYSPGHPHPVRVEWDGDCVESLRLFDVETQRTIEKIDEVMIHPPRELLMPETPEECSAAVARIEAAVRPSLRRDRFIEAVYAGTCEEGLEVFQPFFSPVGDIFSLGAADVVLVDEERIRARFAESWEEAERESRESDLGYDPALLWLSELPALAEAARIETLPIEGVPVVPTEALPPSQVDARIIRIDLKRLENLDDHVLLVTSLPDRLRDLVKEEKLDPELVEVRQGQLLSGGRLPSLGLSVCGDADIFGHRRKKTGKGKSRRSIADWGALREGDFVVHIHHGVGIFRGIERILTLGETRDVVVIEYAGGDRIYLPPHETNLVERYTVLEGVSPRLDKLGSTGWAKIRERAERDTAEIARELLDLYALRATAPGVTYVGADADESFAKSFGYDETEDQAAAIQDVLNDLEKTEGRAPMDRLVCGDVGFGKTEVALRAAFRVVQNGKQVAVLCPTTILALQHSENFRERFEPFGIRVGTLSRFQTPKEQKETIAGLAAGTVGIVIGTHAILGSTVRFRDLGLVVIDEEQRFGVRHKEKLKSLRKQVDILTMTATPIPRTLHLALSGARAVSIIETPPPGRAPIQTIVEPFNEEHVRRAIRRELDRSGQVFYVHNRIETIDRVAELLRRLFPKVSMAVAHGRMDEEDLSRVMRSFLHGETEILVSTSIVENGIDIPRANTMIVDGAERFGLAQLYQLRGRVGRSRTKAYAYFFHAPAGQVTEEARARLAAIAEHTALGSGYSIARRDMEIRGAGEILGAAQHGEMEAIGYDMYCRLLREAIAELKGEGAPKRKKRTVVDLILSAFIPPDWLGGEELVSAVHREIAAVETVAEVDRIREGLIDRFGQPPAPVENLLAIASLRCYASLDSVESIIESEHDIRIRWRKTPAGIERYLALLPPPLYVVQYADQTAVIEGIPKDRGKIEWLRRILRR